MELQRLQDARVESLLELLAGVTNEGWAYKVDLRLRPEGATGLLARSWSSFPEYARRFMQPWERMALVRSRILTDSAAVRSRWDEVMAEAVYDFPWKDEDWHAIRHLKRRIETETNKESRIYLDFKFGRGGVSDLEFLVKMLQVRHGRSNPAVRSNDVPLVLAALRDAGHVSSDECQQLMSAQQFQRRVENRYQLMEEWTSREISRESPLLERLARSLGYRGTTPGEARKTFLADWHHTSEQVRNLVEKYFYASEH
jgi:glutamate-ammonia-ligase adenylyltransferase